MSVSNFPARACVRVPPQAMKEAEEKDKGA